LGVPQNDKIVIRFTLSLGFLAYPQPKYARVSNDRLTPNLKRDRRRNTIGTTLLHGKSNFPNYRAKRSAHLAYWHYKRSLLLLLLATTILVSNDRLTPNLKRDRRRNTIGTTLLHGKSNFPNYRVKKTTHLTYWHSKTITTHTILGDNNLSQKTTDATWRGTYPKSGIPAPGSRHQLRWPCGEANPHMQPFCPAIFTHFRLELC